ncbi:hypothetical protein DASC09_040760 [Saccharomycopsis crataegensis]|uniref:Major facilitator superfamily (MFS) profile domain-containing protein n=1 Tax=Saccharomycopsis crataegensis TaxID=43959 RepID=A0AAV5QQB1_9ASCO|nr:hypothetical protein DASC09_040760 [Saccharomycopsis crataegensis]
MAESSNFRTFSLPTITVLLCSAGVMMGLDTSSIAVFLSYEPFIGYFEHPNSFIQGMVVASNPAGAFC